MKNLFKILILSLFTFSFGEDCVDGAEVELWGECYNIEETTYLDLSNSGLTGELPSEIFDLINLTHLYLINTFIINPLQSNKYQALFKTHFLDDKHPLLTTFISQYMCLY